MIKLVIIHTKRLHTIVELYEYEKRIKFNVKQKSKLN